MSDVIDERVVSLDFDNSRFESGVQQTLKTVQNLTKTLDFNGAHAFDGLDKAAKKVDISPLSKAFDVFADKSTWATTTALNCMVRLENRVLEFAKKVTNALTIQPIKAGFNTYEARLEATQTIMSATGESLDKVNQKIDELNRYSDETIYSFKDMTTNIGKFTNAGVSLDDSVQAIMGVSNAAAIAGANANEASRAMYNLAQSLAMGYVQYIDWKSIENANMATKQFKQHIADVGVAMGTVQKINDDCYEVAGKQYNLQGLFKDALKDQWLTSETLIKVLKEYADAETEVGKKGFAAAKDIKTFTQMMETLSEGAASKWATTFQLIIGDLTEAKVMLKQVAAPIDEMISQSAEFRNGMLSQAFTDGFSELKETIDAAGLSNDVFEEKLIRKARVEGIAIDSLIKKYDNLTGVISAGGIPKELISDVLKDVAKTAEDTEVTFDEEIKKLEGFKKAITDIKKQNFSSTYEEQKALKESLSKAGYDYAATETLVNKVLRGEKVTIEELSKSELSSLKYTDEQIKKLSKYQLSLGDTTERIGTLTKMMGRANVRFLWLDTLRSGMETLKNVIGSAQQGFLQVFGTRLPDAIENTIDKIHTFVTGIEFTQSRIDAFTKGFKGLFLIADSVGYVFKSGINFVLKVLKTILPSVSFNLDKTVSSVGDLGERIHDFVHSVHPLETAFKKIEPYLQKVPGLMHNAVVKAKEFGNAGKEAVQNFIAGFQIESGTTRSKILAIFKKLFGGIKEAINVAFGTDSKGEVGKTVRGAFDKIIKGIKDAITNIVDVLYDFFNSSEGNGKKIATVAKDIDYGLIARLGLLGTVMTKLLKGFMNLTATTKTTKSAFATAKNFFYSFTSTVTTIKSGITKVSNSMRRSNNAKTISSIADAIQTLATSVLLIAVACRVISKCDWEDIAKAGAILTVVTTLLVALVGGLVLLDQQMGNRKFNLSGINAILESGVLIAMGAVVGEMVALMAVISIMVKKNPLGTMAAFAMISGFIVELGIVLAAITYLSKFGKGTGIAAVALVIATLAAALVTITASIVILGNMKTEKLAKGGIAVGTIVMVLGGITAGIVALSGKITASLPAIAGIVVLINTLSTAVIEIALACKLMADVEWGTIGKMEVLLISIAGIATAMTYLVKTGIGSAVGAGALMIGFSSALLLVALGIKELGKLSEDEIGKGLIVIGALAGIFTVMMIFSKGSSQITKVGKDFAISGSNGFLGLFIGFSAACLIMAIAIGKMASYSPEQLAIGIGVIAVLSGIFDVMLLCAKGAQKAGKGATGAILSLVASVGIMALIVAKLSELDPAKATVGVAAIAALSLVVDVMMVVATKLDEKKIGGTLLALSVMLLAMAGSIVIVSKFKGTDLAGAVIAMGLMLSVVTGMMAILSKLKISAKTTASLTMLSIMVGAVGVSIAAVCAFAKDGKEALIAATAISEVILALGVVSVLVSNLGGTGGGFAKGTLALAVLAAFMVALGYAFSLMSGIDAEVMTNIADALCKTMLSLGALAVAVAAIGAIGPAGFVGVGVIATLIAAIAGIGILAAWATMEFIIKHEADINKLGEIFGSFGEKIKPLKDALGGIEAGALDGMVGLMKTFCEMSKMKFAEDNVQGISTLTEFTKFLPELANSMVQFSNILTDGNFNSENVKAAAACGEMISKLWGSLPREGGKFQEFFGSVQDLSEFTNKLVPLGEGIRGFAESVNGENIDYDLAEKAANMATVLSKLQDNLPSTGGRLQEWFGTKSSLTEWGNQLYAFGRDCRFFAEGVRGYDEVAPDYDMAVKAAEMAEVLATLQNKLPSTGGRLQEWFGGKIDLVTWGNGLWNFGRDVRFFAEGIRGYDDEAPDFALAQTAADVAETLATLANKLPSFGGKLSEWFLGDKQTLGNFGGNLKTFGMNLATVLNSWGDIECDDSKVTLCQNVAEFLVSLESGLPEKEGKLFSWFTQKQNLGSFAENLKPFGAGLKAMMDEMKGITAVDALTVQKVMEGFNTFSSQLDQNNIDKLASLQITDLEACKSNIIAMGGMLTNFQTSMADINTYSMEHATESLKNLIDMAKMIDDKSFGGLSNFKVGMENIGYDSVSNFCSIFENSDDKVTEAFQTFNDTITKSMEDNLKAWEVVGEQLITRFITGTENKKSEVENQGVELSRAARKGWNSEDIWWFTAGENFTKGLIKGMNSQTWALVSSVTTLGHTAIETLMKALDEHSPSKITYGIGEYFVDGLTNGIESKYASADGVSSKLGNNLIDAMESAMTDIDDMMNGKSDGITIRPVVDLSNVEKAAGNISDIFGNSPTVNSAIKNISSSYGTNSSKYASLMETLSGMDTGSTTTNNTYNVNGVTYDDGTNVANAVESLISAANIRRRV